jgi:hypothetical protein
MTAMGFPASDPQGDVEICTARIRIYGDPKEPDAVLQQMWHIHGKGGSVREEWRDVPIVARENAGQGEPVPRVRRRSDD